jgi:hypothetical protein
MHHRRVNLLTAYLATILLSASALAQQPAPEPSPATMVSLGTDDRADFTFPGGTVQQYMDAAAKVFGPMNVFMRPAADSIPVLPVELSRVTRGEAISLLKEASLWKAEANPHGSVFVVYALASQGQIPKKVNVWPLARILSQMKPDDALSAVEAALDLAGKGAEVKFHSDTSLLIVSGWSHHIDAVSQVVDRLDNVAGWRESEAELAERKQTAAGIEEEVRALQDEVARLSAELKALMQATPGGTPGGTPGNPGSTR